MYDIVIVGAGPAGSTLARLLSNKLKVAVIDKKTNDEHSFKKPCGGLLAPDAQKALAKFKITFPLDIMVDPQIFSVKTIDMQTDISRYYQRFYMNFDRHKFDMWLLSLVDNNVDIISGARCNEISKEDDIFKIKYTQNQKEFIIKSKYIVGADGAKSIVRNTFIDKKIRQYTCIQKSYKAEKSVPYFTCFFDNRITDCYGWINVKNEYVQLGVALPKENSVENFEYFRKYFYEKGYPFEKEEYTEACLVNSPSRTSQISLGNDGVFLIGEAAGFVSPSSLEGISYAMDSALILAEILNKNPKNPNMKYKNSARKLKFKMFLKICKSKVLYTPFLRKLVMKSGITAVEIHGEENK